MGLLDDLEFLKKRKPNLLADVRQLQRPSEPYLRQQYPEVYGGLGGLLGMAPDEMAGSVLDPNTARVRAGAQIGFPVGTAAQVLPMLAPAVKAGARALGPTAVGMGERYLQSKGLMPGVVPEGGAIPGRDVITPQSKKELKSLADSFAEQIRALGFDAKVEHSGSKAGASSYINVSDPKTGRFLAKPIRISDHSKGPFESQNVINILNPEDDFPKVFEELNKMRTMGESLVFKQQKYAQSLIDDGVKPKVAYQRAKDEVKETPTSTLYPAEERMAIAQRNAALPVEQGGLGLPAGNTAMDRAAASGLDVETNYIHSTNKPFSQVTDNGQFSGIFTLPNYSANYGSVDMPLMTSGKIATSQDLQNLIKKPTKKMQMAIDETIPLNLTDPADIADATVGMQKLRNQLARKYGFDGVRISDEFGNDTVALVNPDNIRSRFAAFDPFRRNAAIAAAMGAAAPDLLAGQNNEMPDAVRQYMANPASGLLQDEDERKKLGGLLFR
jgi:hypothetical protein